MLCAVVTFKKAMCCVLFLPKYCLSNKPNNMLIVELMSYTNCLVSAQRSSTKKWSKWQHKNSPALLMFTKGNVQEYVDSIIKGRLRVDASLWRQDNVLIFTFFTFGELPSSFSRLTDPKCKLEIESSREGRCSPWIANQRIILVERSPGR